MKLRGIDFGNILGASGVQGFFGEGYWFHKIPMFGADFSGMTFISKTATLLSIEGNMILTKRHTPKHFFPSCVKTKWLKGIALNSVGLSNHGLGALLGTGKWQKLQKPFMVSIMSLADTTQRRLEELRIIVEMIGLYKEYFSASFGLQINLSCPNTGHNPSELIGESARVLDVANALGVPLMLKYSIASAPIEAIMELNSNPHCDAICVSNTLPYNWKGVGQTVWGKKESPLAKIGGGGLSGSILCPLVSNWILHIREAGFTKPINGGGGILCCKDVDTYKDSSASSVFLGSVAMLRPWRVKGIIKHANSLIW